jgi:hypothetical protein
MWWNASRLAGYAIEAVDGSIGSIEDIFFDDALWRARWIVVDTGTWLRGRRVLLSPLWVKHPDPAAQKLAVTLTRQQVEDSPDVASDQPVSRRIEESVYRHYRREPYWYVPLGDASTPMPMREAAGSKPGAEQEPLSGDPHLRSLDEVRGSYIHGTDGDIGHVHDFLLDDDDWSIRYMVVSTRNWWPGKKVLISPGSISEISWTSREVTVGLTREAIRSSPEYEPMSTVDRAYEERLHRHYGIPQYWD